MTASRTRAKVREQLNQCVTRKEAALMAMLNEHENNRFFYADYLSLELIKLGLVDTDVLTSIRSRWDQMDYDSKGYLTKENLSVQHAFDLFDTSHLGVIDKQEFAQLCKFMAIEGEHPYFREIIRDKDRFDNEYRAIIQVSVR